MECFQQDIPGLSRLLMTNTPEIYGCMWYDTLEKCFSQRWNYQRNKYWYFMVVLIINSLPLNHKFIFLDCSGNIDLGPFKCLFFLCQLAERFVSRGHCKRKRALFCTSDMLALQVPIAFIASLVPNSLSSSQVAISSQPAASMTRPISRAVLKKSGLFPVSTSAVCGNRWHFTAPLKPQALPQYLAPAMHIGQQNHVVSSFVQYPGQWISGKFQRPYFQQVLLA